MKMQIINNLFVWRSRFIKSIMVLSLLIILTITSCRDFVEIAPPIAQVTGKQAFSSEVSAGATIAGIYSRMMSDGIVRNTTPYTAMYADELINYIEGANSEFSRCQLSLTNSPTLNSSFWNSAYTSIYATNQAIEQLNQSETLTPDIKNSLLGEAKFIRAYIYFNLVNLFGDVPLILRTDYQSTSFTPQSSTTIIYNQIVQDLNDAISMLPSNVLSEKIRVNKWAAKAMLARIYLFNKEWALAEELSNEVIESKLFTLNTDVSKIFLKNSSEAILQFYPTQHGQNTPDALAFIPSSLTEEPKYYINQSLLDAFENGDSRKSAWIGSRTYNGEVLYYPTKYKIRNTGVVSEYYMILRLAEQYLIRAEAKIQLNKVSEGIIDLNVIRTRAREIPATPLDTPLPDLSLTPDKATALLKVEQERRIELMVELGHRWYDLNRTQRSNAVIGSLKRSTWESYDVLWPIPQEQLKLNTNLKQNLGYNF